MSGHSKWSKIKRAKGASDSKRSKIFSRIVKEIQVAVKEGGPSEDTNARLRLAIQNAKGQNMPKDTVLRAINKASSEGANLMEITFEGYGPGGVAVFIECLSDNNNRTVSNIRSIFNKKNGTLGTNGSLSFLFERKGVITVNKTGFDPDDFQLEIIDAGVDEVEDEGDVFVLTCSFENFAQVRKKLEEMGIEAQNAELQRVPNDYKKTDTSTAMKLLRMVDDFEEDEDVQGVFHNLEMNEDIMEAMNRL
jgi:YebC/PmpR family DNA-binding regulatory protein